MTSLDDIFDSVVDGKADACRELVRAGLEHGLDPGVILNEGLIPAMREIGSQFERQECYIPEMLVAARAMQAGLGVIRPVLVNHNVKPIGKVAIGAVKGDLHDIGKNLVAMMLEGGGFEVVDLGIDTPPERFVQAAREGAQLIGISALLTTTMLKMRDVIEALRDAGVRHRVKVIVGGAPVDGAFAEQIEADGYASDASRAVILAKVLLGLE